MQSFSYIRPATLQEAVDAFASLGTNARYIAGGTTLYDLMKLDIEMPAHLVDVTAVEGLGQIETDGDTLRFGSRALMADVAAHAVISRDYPVLSEALSKAASQ
jgi:xanthine dehydrogenase YagS FAD-binding subunit